ncbi:MAG: sce7725 family protein [Maribacter arcticus]|uniref:sce7725 family protein n=1 Tax=Maribacter arcticus TaxID=561365 RepID=UPI0030016BD3
MVYFPYFRGKQFELIAIRESAKFFKDNEFVPIIEPVKKELKSLKRALDFLCEENTDVIVIINPLKGDLNNDGESIVTLLEDEFPDNDNIIFGILLTEDLSAEDAFNIIERMDKKEIAIIHAGFSDAKGLATLIQDKTSSIISIFFEDYCGKLYRRHFSKSKKRVLLRDGFQKRTNRNHPQVEFFSDLHATYTEEGMDAFGDFLIVGDEYLTGGGPAYTIAIHLTFIDNEKDEEMHINHFKSIRQNTPKDPAGKFAEALDKLIFELSQPNCKILKTTSAIIEFKDLHSRGHFPGLGHVKKLSMKHHIETLGHFFE